jgi:multidrug resistance efflux pump
MPEDKEKLRSEAVQDILTRVPHWMILWGNTIVLALLVLFFVFTWFIKYPDIISAEAIVTSRTPPEKEYAQISGKLDTILVKDNQKIMVGETLAMIENTAGLSDVLRLKAALDTISIQNKSFRFPVDKIPMLSLGEISSAYAIFEKDYIDYSLNITLDPYSNQITSNRISENELQLRLKSYQNQRAIDKKKFELSKSEFLRNKTLYEKGVISLNEYESKQLKYLEDEKQLKNLEISFSQLNQSINEASLNSKETKINNQMEDTRLFKNLIQSYTQLKEAIKVWELKYLLKSNIEGKLSFVNVWTKNQNVKQGDLLFTIVPDNNEQYLAKIKAPIQNSGKIRPGQNVNIKLLNYPETEYGMLEGTIKTISAIPNDEGFYMVQASLDSTLTTSYNIQIPFINEMNGNAEIVTEDLRLLERFFYQLRGIFNN